MSDANAQAPFPTPRQQRATVRLSQRELSRISCGVVVFIVAVLGFLGYRAMMGFKANHDLLIAKENLHMLHEAFFNYAQDWDQRLPPADRWTESISGYLSSSGQPGGALAALHGPGDGKQIRYVYNDLAAGYSLESGKSTASTSSKRYIDPSRLILLIEQAGAEDNAHMPIPPQGNPEAEQALLKALSSGPDHTAFPHGSDDTQNASTVVLYANGSQRVLTRRELEAPGQP